LKSFAKSTLAPSVRPNTYEQPRRLPRQRRRKQRLRSLLFSWTVETRGENSSGVSGRYERPEGCFAPFDS
jgi:hypothetical protein